MKTIKGNLLDYAEKGLFDVVIHGANCQNTMGSGIAKEIKERYPEVYKKDCLAAIDGENKLGEISFVRVERAGYNFYVVNAYTQENYGPPPTRYVDYEAVRKCFNEINRVFPSDSFRFGFPKIGAGRGGGDWEVIELIIKEELEGRDHTLVIL